MLLQSCRLLDRPHRVDVRIEGGRIAQISEALEPTPPEDVLNLGGKWLCPGFIDIHIHGAGDGELFDATPESIVKMSTTLARWGTTAFVGTTMVRPGDNRHLGMTAEMTGTELPGARCLGIHLEGPFIQMERRGGIPKSSIYPPSENAFQEVLDWTRGTLRMLTLAPELPGMDEVIEACHQHGVIPAMGHTSVTYEQTLKAFRQGVSHFTHLFNAMPGMHHRHPGPISALFDSDRATAQLICDGQHVHPSMIRMVVRNVGIQRIIGMTDGMRSLGLPDGEYFYDDRPYTSRDGVARYPDGTLIGTTMSQSQMAALFCSVTGVSMQEAIEIFSTNPARVLGLDQHKGRVAPGYDADLVVMDSEFTISHTLVAGQTVYTASDTPA